VDLEVTIRTLTGFIDNPNVYGALIVGLGCEVLGSHMLESCLASCDKPIQRVDIQTIRGGTVATVDAGICAAKELVGDAQEIQREPFDLSDLMVGTECGGSDSISWITANPAVGFVADRVVDAGGTVILPEMIEWIGTEQLLLDRMVDETVKQHFLDVFNFGMERFVASGLDFRGVNPTPGNIKGGLSTIEEKSLGTVIKGGSSPIQGILNYAEKPSGKGLWLMFEPGYDVASMVAMAAAGAQVIIMTTGRGSPTGIPIAPVIKVSGNPHTCEWMQSNIDVDASRIITNGASITDVGENLWQCLHQTCNGQHTKAEQWGHQEFDIWKFPHQSSVVITEMYQRLAKLKHP
jgi:altronate dehydratase large subunit